MYISWNADQVEKDAENHGKIQRNNRRKNDTISVAEMHAFRLRNDALFPLCFHDLLVFKTLFFIKDTLFV